MPKSETFVLAQANNLRWFKPFFTGVQHTGGLALPEDRLCSLAGDGLSGAALARWFKLTGFAPNFLNKLRCLKPAIVHAHFEESGLAALPLSRALGIPLITTFHGYDATATPVKSGPRALLNQIYGRQRRRLQQEGSFFVAVSGFIREKLIARGYPAERIVVVPIGVDVDIFTPQREAPAIPMVLFVGRLVEKKGVSYLLKAMAEVAKIRQDVKLVIIGDGPLKSELMNEAWALNVPNVNFMGACDPATVRQQMSVASLLAAPSVTAASGDSEGLPIVVCEAQAMGLPVVGTRHAGIPEIVEHGTNGFLVPERSALQLAQSISWVINQPPLRRQLGLAARENVCRNFNLKTQTVRLEELYKKAVGEHARAKETP